jgi:thioredoxin 1
MTIINKDNFELEVLQSDVPVLVDFWAEWCGPCKMIAPVLDELASDYQDKVKIAKVNVDENAPLAAKYGINSIPTLLLFNGGQVTNQIVGVRPKKDLTTALDSALA